MPKHTVLIPLDGSDFSGQILTAVHKFFNPSETCLILLRVAKPIPAVPPLVTDPPFTGRAIPELYEAYSTQLEQRYAWSSQAQEGYRAEVQLEMKAEVTALQKSGYSVSAEIAFGDPAQQIVKFAQDSQVDLIAMTTHGRTGLGRLVMGSVAEQVLRHTHIPVLFLNSMVTAPDKQAAHAELLRNLAEDQPLSLAVATDGSTFGQPALQLSAKLAKALHAHLTVLVVASDQENVVQDQHVMDAVAEQVAEIKPHPMLIPIVGFADEVILNYVTKTPPHLLIMGAFRDRGAGASHAIGVTAQRVVQQAPVPVLIVKGHQVDLQRLLLCADVDDSTAVEFAARLAQHVGAQLDLLHVVPAADASPLTQPTSTPSTVETALQQESTLSAVMPTWLEELTSQGYGREQILLRQGSVAESILAQSRQTNYDLIIVGSQADAGHFAHTVANSVVSFAEQSVLVLRAHPRT